MCNKEHCEKIADYVSRLQNLAEYCNFSDLDRQLRDRFIAGILDTRIKKRLFDVKSDEKFDKVVKPRRECNLYRRNRKI